MTPTDKHVYWQNHITAWQQSNGSQKAYCHKHNLSLATFCYWKHKLAAVEAKPSKLIPVRMSPPPAAVQVRLSWGVELNVPVASVEEVLPILARAAEGPV